MSTALLATTKSLRNALCGLEPSRYSGEDAARLTRDFSLTKKVLEAALVRLAARAAECGEHRKDGCSRPEHWLGRQTGTSEGEARRKLDLAARLNDHPSTKDALEKGEVSLDEAEEAVKTEEESPGSEDEILDEAKKNGLKGAREKGRRIRQRAQDIDELEAKRWAARGVREWTDELGMVNVLAKLLPEEGTRFLARLEAETERQWRSGNRGSTIEQRAHDAFVKMLEGKGRGPTTRPELVLVWNLNDDTAHIPGVGPVTRESALDLAKEAVVSVVLHDGVKVDTIVRHTRSLPPELRTLIEMGAPPDFDGPACSRCGGKFRLQKDHIDPKNHGGPISLENLDTPCPTCHEEKTREDRAKGLLSPEARPEKRRNAGTGPPTKSSDAWHDQRAAGQPRLC